MSNTSTQLAATTSAPVFVKASAQLASFLGIESSMMLETIKAQCFKGTPAANVSDAQLAAFVSVAAAMKLNPLLPGMLYCYPERNGGIQPMIGPDGVYMLLANNPDIVASEKSGSAWWTEHGKDGDEETCTAYINHRGKGLIKKTIYVKEWLVSSNPNWQSRRRHMAEIRALKQCARQILHGIPMDEDERKLADMTNVTESVTTTPPPPAETLSERIDAKRSRGRPRKEAQVVEGEVTQPAVDTTLPSEESAKAAGASAGTVASEQVLPAHQTAPAAAPTEQEAPQHPPEAPEASTEEPAARQALIDKTQDRMLELGLSEKRLRDYGLKIQGLIPADNTSIWDLPMASIEKLAKAIPALSVGRTPAT